MTATNGHTSDGRDSVPPNAAESRPSAPSVDHLARSLAAALARTLRAYLPLETRSVEARLDALDADITELRTSVRRLGESLAHSHEDAT